jgi:hypothetical protein
LFEEQDVIGLKIILKNILSASMSIKEDSFAVDLSSFSLHKMVENHLQLLSK